MESSWVCVQVTWNEASQEGCSEGGARAVQHYAARREQAAYQHHYLHGAQHNRVVDTSFRAPIKKFAELQTYRNV